MQGWLRRGGAVALTGAILAACGGTTSSSGASEVVLTGEDLTTVGGSQCAVEGHATNVGNLRINVTVRYEARSATGTVLGTSTASFQIAPFSKFDFTSSPFTNNLACSGIASFRRTDVDVTHT
jgi:hypothetical protein